MQVSERGAKRVLVLLAAVVLVLAATTAGLWRWRASMAPVSSTGYAMELHQHILDAQLERWPKAVDGWHSLTQELEVVRSAREALGEDAEALRVFTVADAKADGLPVINSLVERARAFGMFEASERISEISIAARPYDQLAPTDMLVGVMFDDLRGVRFLARTQLARAYVATQSGAEYADELHTAIDESLSLAQLLSWQGSTLEYLYARIVATATLDGLRELLSIAPIHDDARLQALDKRIERFQRGFAPASHIVEGDRLMTLDSLHRMHTAGGHLDHGRGSRWDGAMGAIGFDHANYRGPLKDSLAWLDRFVEAANTSARARGSAILEADAALDSAHAAFVDLGDGPGERWPALMIVLGRYSQPIDDDRRVRIAAAGTRVVLAIERYRLAHGQPPQTLEQLGDLLPDGLGVDPVTEQPWAYERTDAGYTLASRALPGSGAQDDAAGDPLAGVVVVP